MTNLLVKLFVKDYQNVSNFKVREKYGKFASTVGIATNLLLFAIKIIAGALSGSIAIIADAVNNLSDSGSSLVTFVGFKISGKPADAGHPYGHARMEYISGLIVSFIILLLGFQLIQVSISKIINPQAVEFSLISVLILLISILIKLWQSFFYSNIAEKINSLTMKATSMDSRNDTLSTLVVLIGILVTRWTGFNLDGYLGLAVALFIVFSGIKLIRDTINPLLGTPPTKELVNRISETILSYDHIIGLHDLTVHNYGPGKSFASVHCEVSAEQDIMVSHDIIDNIERDFLKNYNIQLVIHLDPVVISDEKTNALKEKVAELIAGISPRISMHDFRVVWGVSHSNLIFDVAAPFDFEVSHEELMKQISDQIYLIDAAYHSVITIEHSFYPND